MPALQHSCFDIIDQVVDAGVQLRIGVFPLPSRITFSSVHVFTGFIPGKVTLINLVQLDFLAAWVPFKTLAADASGGASIGSLTLPTAPRFVTKEAIQFGLILLRGARV